MQKLGQNQLTYDSLIVQLNTITPSTWWEQNEASNHGYRCKVNNKHRLNLPPVSRSLRGQRTV